jgi:molecular chaperone GrpE
VTETRRQAVPPDSDAVEHAAPDSAADGVDLDSVIAERDRYFEQLQRTAADFANYRRRTEQERAQQRLAANERLLRDFVPVLDDLQRGLDALPADEQDAPLAEGMRRIEQKFLATLGKHGVTPIDALGSPFDPSVHEALDAEPGGDTVVSVYAPGYLLGESVLRPAMVKVGRAEGKRG